MYFQLLDEINALDPESNRGRKRKLSNERALIWVLHVLFHGIPWSACSDNTVDSSTIRRRFAKWTKAGIFSEYRRRLTVEYLQRHPCKDLVIDASFVKNVSGHDVVGKNPTDRGRLATKISVVCSDTGIPVGMHFAPGNISDSQLVEQTLEDIPNGLFSSDKRRRFCLIGDRGYVLKSEVQTRLLATYRMRVVRPQKKNDRKYRLSQADRTKLQKRNCI